MASIYCPVTEAEGAPVATRMLKDTQQPPPGVKTGIPVRVSGYFVTPGYQLHLCSFGNPGLGVWWLCSRMYSSRLNTVCLTL